MTGKILRTWISFLAGITFATKFVFVTPELIRPELTLIILVLIFGPGILALWKGSSSSDFDKD